MKVLSHIDLFSGIGGFSLASSWAGFKTIVFCEKDKFCQKILNKHWPDVPIIEDIHEFKGEQYSGATLLTGGVPCQPASTAGKRRGTEDDRWLWPETLRIIREAKPKWIILENVRGLISLNGGVDFDNLLSEVEAIGYETRPFVIPACSVNAPHRRERVWIVANTRYERFLQRRSISRINGQGVKQGRMGQDVLSEISKNEETVMANTDNPRCHEQRRGITTQQEHNTIKCSDWWSAEPNVGRLANGVPNRVAKLRALGNAIVPQVAYQIIEKIAMIELEQHQLSKNP